MNGRHLVSAEGTEKLSALVMTPDGKLVLSGGARGVVTLRWLHSLQVSSLIRAHACKGCACLGALLVQELYSSGCCGLKFVQMQWE